MGRSIRVLDLALAAVVAATVVIAPEGAAGAGADFRGGAGTPGGGGRGAFEFALIGDTPYGPDQVAGFPTLVEDINEDRDVDFVVHVGDVKSGSTRCDTADFLHLRDLFDQFDKPFVLTPGDNDWTDCHRTNNGGYLPTERLDAIRDVFFAEPTRALGGGHLDLVSQGAERRSTHPAYVENRLWSQSGVVFATIHVVGSNNDLQPWAQLPGGDRPDLRLAEFEARQAANLAWVDRAFDEAEQHHAPGVLIALQANMTEAVPSDGFTAVLDRLRDRAAAYGKPVVLAQGDFHELLIDHPLADLPNVTHVQTYGEEIDHWIEVRVDPRSGEVFSFEPHTVGRRGVRFATFNASLNRNQPGQLVADLSTPDNVQAQTVAEIIQRDEPDVLLINEFDFDPTGQAIDLFRNNYLRLSQNGARPVSYPYAYVAPSNTGIPSGFDLNNDGTVGGPDDAFGFGAFEGQYGMAILSRMPIDVDDIRTFQDLRWSAMPDNLIPEGFYTAEERAALRLSSKSHWDVPVVIGDDTVHVLASHPTPPVFDGPEDRNGRRNHDEIRFWADYLSPSGSRWIVDDAGHRGGLGRDESFVVLGDLNADPLDGDSVPGAAQQLLDHPRVDAAPHAGEPGCRRAGRAAGRRQRQPPRRSRVRHRRLRRQRTGQPAASTTCSRPARA